MLKDAEAGILDMLMVDDLSRLSRDDYEMKGVLRKFAWQGLRVIGVSDGYDSARKGHKIHAGFKGLMNEMFLDDLRDKTHRGMTGQALKGYNCGGRTYGYRNVPIEDESRRDAYGRPMVVAVRYEIDEAQSAIVRQIHESVCRWACLQLDRRSTEPQRRSILARRHLGYLRVKVILENEMYEGRLIWNRREWAKHPDTGKRTYRERPKIGMDRYRKCGVAHRCAGDHGKGASPPAKKQGALSRHLFRCQRPALFILRPDGLR